MSKKVLIAYGSRFGSTEEIARKIGEVIVTEGVESELVDLRKTKKGRWPSPSNFDGVLVGSGIKIMKWTKEAESFLKVNSDYFKEGGTPLGLFVSCLSRVTEGEEGGKEYLVKIMETLGIHAVLYEAFGAVLDFSSSSRMDFLNKKMLRMGMKEASKEKGLVFDENGRNDYREWEQIEEFAKKFVSLIK
ncbi:MAG: hypothetical protein HXS41_06810 [Theionarchaea archaeon]|nr:hypothetical protein [Theionarchaea archaeon]MBU7000311.1 hypothetical protein [Theionarchaea archaeon]MBU7020752.1 hypothetical protein [Theionarchaea archaeon]MBU7034887.1 hypothetical protein [Theionarchaea archaeon]MBU7040116.1 hypothetical protein [Theionarchaea archaeon]